MPDPVGILESLFAPRGSLFTPRLAATIVTPTLVPAMGPIGGVVADTCAVRLVDPCPATTAWAPADADALSAKLTVAGMVSAPGLLLARSIVSVCAARKPKPAWGFPRRIVKSSGPERVFRKVSAPLN